MTCDEDPFRRRPEKLAVKTTGGVCLDDGNYGEMAFPARRTHQNLATAQLPRESHSNGGALGLGSPWI
jgi:hypothetical protein